MEKYIYVSPNHFAVQKLIQGCKLTVLQSNKLKTKELCTFSLDQCLKRISSGALRHLISQEGFC